jgi:hypothetical protein
MRSPNVSSALPNAVGTGCEEMRLLFIGDDWAEAHHDIEILTNRAVGLPGVGYLRVWMASPGYTR